MRSGFTLVELAIVLVIIGLLIGGILVAQSMVSTAKIQNTIRQLAQYDTAVYNFLTQYNQLPGDSKIFSGGNNNGIIGQSLGGTVEFGEIDNFWSDLSLGIGLQSSLNANYQVFDISSDNLTNANCPQFKLTQDQTSHPCLLAYTGNLTGGNYYLYSEPAGPFQGISSPDPLLAVDALAIDKKIDNGLPLTGSVIGQATGLNPTTNCYGVTNYSTNNTDYGCSLFIRMGLSSNPL